MEKKFIRVDEVARVLEISESHAYKIMRKLNRELEAKGYITVAGRVNRQYFNERFYGAERSEENAGLKELSSVKSELAQYKSVRGKLRTADLEQENDRLRSRLRTYEDVISRNNLWHFFSGSRNKNRNRDDAR